MGSELDGVGYGERGNLMGSLLELRAEWRRPLLGGQVSPMGTWWGAFTRGGGACHAASWGLLGRDRGFFVAVWFRVNSV